MAGFAGAERYAPGSCERCHHDAQHHYDALAAENAELKAQLAESKLMLQEAQAYGKAQQRWAHELRGRNDALQAQLAGADALLREIDDDLEIGAHPQLHRERIRAYFAPDSARENDV